MNITINTDASFCSKTKAAAFAFYIVGTGIKITGSGVFKADVKNSEVAETMAIGNAIHALLAKDIKIDKVYYIIINTDCLTAINKLSTGKGLGTHKKVRILKEKLVKRYKPKRFEFRHVKAHNGAPDARSWVNDWCDREAKRHMRKERKKRVKNLVVT